MGREGVRENMGVNSEKRVDEFKSRGSNRTRDLTIDFLRTIGILCIILAHCQPPKLIYELRNFDVPLMVFVSGFCANSFSNKYKFYGKYVIDRFIRLILPTWIFLTLYFTIRFTAGFPLPTRNIISAYLMLDQAVIGVWIIRVFFFMSLLTPLVGYLSKHYNSFITLFILLSLNELFFYLMHYFNQSVLFLEAYKIILLYNLAYGYVLFAGFNWNNLDLSHKIFYLLFFSAIFILCCAYLFKQNGALIPLSGYKFPPELYYLSYALSFSMILFLLKDFDIMKIL